ncbi:hypothetical protein LAZ67_1004471 [Cordylochernes scorpioides]|uniref:Uncharacterized protein n=1 Tax=Cordylochernes scorpioides TaxID=51811 RepID=A0ABY6K0I9_9ARAC|nr:hypothetical protein LAZ67_1004471 [Cordylochernes scorpioides]
MCVVSVMEFRSSPTPVFGPLLPHGEEIELIKHDLLQEGDSSQIDDLMMSESQECLAKLAGEPAAKQGYWVLYKGLVYAVLSSVFFSLCSVFVHYLDHIHPGELACLRFLGILILSAPLVIYNKQHPLGPRKLRPLLILRGMIGATSLFLRFYALHYLPIADASVIIFSVPVLVSILACIFLNEPCGLFETLTVVLTLVGISLIMKLPLIIRNSMAFYNVNHIRGVLAAGLSTLFGACVYIVVRKVKSVHHSVIMLNFGWVAIIQTSLITLAIGTFSLPRCGLEKVLILLLGIFSFLGQMFLTLALTSEQAGPVSIVRAATDIVLAFLWQIIFFNDIPDWYSIGGAILVSGCVVDGTYRKPIKQETNEEKEAYVKWESEDAISQLLFTTSVMPDVSQLIIPCSSAKDMWDKLLSVYEQSSGQRLDMLYNQFFNFKKDPTDDISKHISKLESLWNDMQNELTKQENLKLPESMLMCRIINTLPDEYFDFKSVWESVSKEERSVDNLTQRLRLLEIRIQQRDECSASSSTALMANAYENKQNMKGKATKSNENFQKTRECYFCHRKGHLAKDCRYAKQKKLKEKEKDETKLKLNSNLSESLISERFNEQDEDIWIGDSGATNHITRNASFYTSYKDFPTQQTVKVGSNEKLIAYGSGTITIKTCVKGKWQTHYLTDVWYVPNFSRNVMSLQSTLDKGFEMKMDKKGCKLFKTTTGEVIVEGKRLPGGLYGMLITSIKPENAAEVNLAKTQNVNMLQLWHERFGHQNKRHVQKWLKEQGIDAVMDNEPCEACIYGKQHRLSFGSREQYASTQPGNLIHVDVCGPMQEVSKGGMRYFVCFKGDFTKYRSVYFLKEKSQVIEKLEQFLLETKTTGHIVKEILTDGGKEFVNKETSKITNKYGINHRITMPYTPQQNGSAERENRTLIEAARSMIYAKNISLKLWAEAVNTATYVLNRTGPTQIEGKTPYELWFDKKPAVDHLRIFGTECFVHVPDEKRRKLDAKNKDQYLCQQLRPNSWQQAIQQRKSFG